MKRYSAVLTGIAASAGMIALILDSKTALTGAAEGISLCIQTVIPALFPFFVLSTLLTGSLFGSNLRLLRPLGKLCGVPSGTESILLSGLIGGYPVGAQCISQAYAAGQLQKSDARRMLGFCSNAGPAFVFGMTGALFDNNVVPFMLWAIHILSALFVAAILPSRSNHTLPAITRKQITAGQALPISLRNMASVCGWVILFRILIAFAARWFLWLLPDTMGIFITGLLELTNGYIDLVSIADSRIRFIFAAVFLGFGGICVGLQTISITGQAGLDSGLYFPGKVLQSVISGILAFFVSGFLFSSAKTDLRFLVLLPLIAILPLLKKAKNAVAFTTHLMYNKGN